jgi:hypothetical protein
VSDISNFSPISRGNNTAILPPSPTIAKPVRAEEFSSGAIGELVVQSEGDLRVKQVYKKSIYGVVAAQWLGLPPA